MKALIISLLFCIIALLGSAQVQVKGYYRKNGTYVESYKRSSPDNNPYNNYSYPGNINPYTGKVATGNPETYLNNYYNKTTPVKPSYQPPYLSPPPMEQRTYWNIKGEKKLYTVFESSGMGTVSYKIYNLNDSLIGYMTEYSNGDKDIYDLDYNLIQKVRK